MALKFDEVGHLVVTPSFTRTHSQQGIINSPDRIRGFWHDLLDGDIDAMRKVDEPTVKALELRAPGSSTFDAEMIQRQLQGAQIFSTFSDHDRFQILDQLRQFQGLIPSLHGFFRNLCYWEACVDSIRHLVTPSRRDTIFTALERQFTGIKQQEGQVVIQVDESNFTVTAGSRADKVEFGCRHIVAFAMRHFVEIPRASVREGVSGKPRAKSDSTVLRQYVELAIRLGFESPEIEELMKTPSPAVSEAIEPSTIPPLVTSGHGEDRDSLFVHLLDTGRDECGEGITSFLVRRWIYVDFLGRPRGTVALAPAEREKKVRERAQQNQAQVQWEREAREEQEREAQAQWEREEQAQRQREARDREARERGAQEQREREERQQREREEQEQREHQVRERVCIQFKIRERNDWRDAQSLWVDRSDPSEVARVAKKSIRKGLRKFDTNMRLLGPDDGSHTKLLVPHTAPDIDDRLLDSASVLNYSASLDSVRNTRPRRE